MGVNMASPAINSARRLNSKASKDVDIFEAFMLGYVHGAQDMDAGHDLSDIDKFEERVRDLHQNEYPGSMI